MFCEWRRLDRQTSEEVLRLPYNRWTYFLLRVRRTMIKSSLRCGVRHIHLALKEMSCSRVFQRKIKSWLSLKLYLYSLYLPECRQFFLTLCFFRNRTPPPCISNNKHLYVLTPSTTCISSYNSCLHNTNPTWPPRTLKGIG